MLRNSTISDNVATDPTPNYGSAVNNFFDVVGHDRGIDGVAERAGLTMPRPLTTARLTLSAGRS